MFWVELTFKRYEDPMIFAVFIFIFSLEPTARKQLDEKLPNWNCLICTAMFKIFLQYLWVTLTAFERQLTIENFTGVVYQRRIRAYSWKTIAPRFFTYFCTLLFCSNTPSFLTQLRINQVIFDKNYLIFCVSLYHPEPSHFFIKSNKISIRLSVVIEDLQSQNVFIIRIFLSSFP